MFNVAKDLLAKLKEKKKRMSEREKAVQDSVNMLDHSDADTDELETDEEG